MYDDVGQPVGGSAERKGEGRKELALRNAPPSLVPPSLIFRVREIYVL